MRKKIDAIIDKSTYFSKVAISEVSERPGEISEVPR